MRIDLQLYLATKMRATDQVSAFLSNLGIQRSEAERAAVRVDELYKLSSPGTSARVYSELAGEPVEEFVVCSTATPSEFAGSVRRRYLLPPWDTSLFEVNEHPDGYAWGERFVRGAVHTLPTDPNRLRVWQCTLETAKAAASAEREIDVWSDRHDAYFSFVVGQKVATFLGRFDFGLLQQWTAVDLETRVD